MALCDHENVVKYRASFVKGHFLWLVMDLLEAGSILALMEAVHPHGLPEILLATVLKPVLSALVYFHSNGQIHRDMKAGNILVGGNGVIQLGDFGVASIIHETDRSVKRKVSIPVTSHHSFDDSVPTRLPSFNPPNPLYVLFTHLLVSSFI